MNAAMDMVYGAINAAPQVIGHGSQQKVRTGPESRDESLGTIPPNAGETASSVNTGKVGSVDAPAVAAPLDGSDGVVERGPVRSTKPEGHTPGSLRVHETGSIYVRSLYVATTVGEAEKANARRIVACWNACEGLSTEELEAGLFLSGPSALAERDALRLQVAELAGALRDAEALRPRMLKDFGYVPEYVLEFCNKARAFLARVKPSWE